jgi:hypothetical protein
MELLINKAYCESYFKISLGLSTTDFEKYVFEAQAFTFKQLFPAWFYADMLQKKEDEKYTDILNEKTFTHDGRIFSHEGLKTVLAYYTMAIYRLRGNAVDTSFGLVTKTNPSSEPVTYAERKEIHADLMQKGGQLFNEVKFFIDVNSDVYQWGEPKNYSKSKIITK